MSLSVARRRRVVSMTSLIDVIFLLLLFFMLSSTFSRFAEVELKTGGAGEALAADQTRILFLRLTESGLSMNGRDVALANLGAELDTESVESAVLISVTDTASAQALTDLLVALRPFPDLSVSVLEAS